MLKQIAAFALFVLATSFASQAHASTFDYPILGEYEASAQNLVSLTRAARTPADLAALQTQTRALVQLGVQIMDLYGSKNPNCLPQYKVFEDAIASMETLPFDQVEKRFHDGEGLPTAPRHCYFGRAQIVHPVMNLIRLKGTWDESVRADVLADFEEVIEHLARIQKNLNTPPN